MLQIKTIHILGLAFLARWITSTANFKPTNILDALQHNMVVFVAQTITSLILKNFLIVLTAASC